MLSGQERVKKLRWQSRRGMKELDVLFETFFARHQATLLDGGWPMLESLLAQEDSDIFGWITGRTIPADPGLQKLIKAITDAA